MRRLVVATHNQKKGQEMREILVARFPDLELLTLTDYPGIEEPEETGTTYAENAVIKAEAAAAATGEACVADDAGLEIDFLKGKPGLQSKRFMGENTPFEEKMAAILERMEGVPDAERTARFRVAVALARPGQPVHSFAAVCEGRIAFAPKGTGGFGYDPIFFLPELGCTMAELTPEQKHAVSHRGKVLKMLGDYIEAHAAIVQSH
jgi:XTP/dITP diphosphohydrolase